MPFPSREARKKTERAKVDKNHRPGGRFAPRCVPKSTTETRVPPRVAFACIQRAGWRSPTRVSRRVSRAQRARAAFNTRANASWLLTDRPATRSSELDRERVRLLSLKRSNDRNVPGVGAEESELSSAELANKGTLAPSQIRSEGDSRGKRVTRPGLLPDYRIEKRVTRTLLPDSRAEERVTEVPAHGTS